MRVYLAFQGLTPNVITGTSTVKTQNGISPGESVPVVRLPREMSESAALVCRPGMVAAIRRGRKTPLREKQTTEFGWTILLRIPSLLGEGFFMRVTVGRESGVRAAAHDPRWNEESLSRIR